MLISVPAKSRLEQASHWEVTKHHLQAAKHTISSDSLTPSGSCWVDVDVDVDDDDDDDQLR